MYEILIIVYLLVALALIGLVLIQQGKGADMGASFGGGASNSVFGSSGAGNFLTRSTAVLAISFFVLSLVIGNLGNRKASEADVWNNLEAEAPVVEVQTEIPATEEESEIPQ